MTNAKDMPDCFGTILPEFDHLKLNKPCHGKAFDVEVESVGLGIQGHNVIPNMAEWIKCQDCLQYKSCYDFCMARLNLSVALS